MSATGFRIGAVGDVMTARNVGDHYRQSPADFAMPEICQTLAANDFVLANLETTVSRRGEPDPRQDPHVAFRARPSSLQILKDLGTSAVTLANNHMLDYGSIALTDTMMHLDEIGIRHFGAGQDYQSANRPLLTEINGCKVALIASVFIFSASTSRATGKRAGVASHRLSRLLRQIRRCRADGYTVIVTIHWGLEYSFFPVHYQMQQARRMIDAGAVLILGHGPHYPQGIERYNNGEIVYSLGNFIFDEPYLFAKRSFIYSACIEGNALVSSEIHPVHLDRHVPELAVGPQKAKLARLVTTLQKLYARKDRRFWQNQNNLYFRDIVWRVSNTKSLKYLFLPSAGFYTRVGLRNYLRKLLSLLGFKAG